MYPDAKELGAGQPPMFTLVPQHHRIELVSYYPEFAHYYPDCELQTKRWFVENVARDWIMFDVGANVGYYSILFSRLAPDGRIFAFEPTKTIDLLLRNLHWNRAHNVRPLNLALGATSGKLVDDIYRIWGKRPERLTYDFVTVDEMVDRLRLDRLDCLKVDVDGFDFEVLQGAEQTIERLNPWIIVELNQALSTRNHSVREALEWLMARGYQHAHVLDEENFVLRRGTENTVAGQSGVAGLQLTFDQRPILLGELFDKGDLVELFSPEVVIHNSARRAEASAERSIFSVPGPRWSYAVAWPRRARQVATDRLIIEIELTVSGADVGLGCVTATMDRYLGKEVFVEPTQYAQRAVVIVPEANAVGCLMLRNADLTERLASVEVHRIQVFNAIPAAAQPRSPLFAKGKEWLSLSECQAALGSAASELGSDQRWDSAIKIVPIEELGQALGFSRPFVTEKKIFKNGPVDCQTYESAIYTYIYRNFKPLQHHLEFGTREDVGAVLCARSCSAEIWIINSAEDESKARGNPLYSSSMALNATGASSKGQARGEHREAIGRRLRAAGFETRVYQVYCDSRQFDGSQFTAGFFDTIHINGDHTSDVVVNDTNKALPLLRSGGIMIWPDFCPDPEVLRHKQAPQGVVRAMVHNYSEWNLSFSQIFWIRHSRILIGVRR